MVQPDEENEKPGAHEDEDPEELLDALMSADNAPIPPIAPDGGFQPQPMGDLLGRPVPPQSAADILEQASAVSAEIRELKTRVAEAQRKAETRKLAGDLDGSVAASLEAATLAGDIDRLENKRKTLRKRVDAQDWQGAARELRKWVFGGGRKLPGLVLRREAEAQRILNPAQ